MVVGFFDVIDTALGGWTQNLDLFERLAFVAIGTLGGFCIGALCGLVWGTVTGIGVVFGVTWSGDQGMYLKSKRILASQYLQIFLVVVVTLWTLFVFLFFSGILSVPVWQVLLITIFVGALLGTASTLWRSVFVTSSIWLFLCIWVYFLETRVLYSFSRYGNASSLHALTGCFLILLVLAALSQGPTKRLWRKLVQYRLPGVVAVVGAVLFIGAARFPLDKTSNDLRLALYERTTILYRLFLHMPHRFQETGTLQRKANCAVDEDGDATAPMSVKQHEIRGVMVIMLDALRGDHAPVAHRPDLTPALSKLATQGISFNRAYTSVPATRYAVRSMMTGFASIPENKIPAETAFLGVQLARSGIRIINVADHRNLKFSMENFEFVPVSEDINIANRKTNGSHLSFQRTKSQLEALSQDQRFFMFVHFYDPHDHYVPNDKFDFGDTLHDRYDAEIAYTDYWVGQLLQHLDASGMADETAVIVLGDHGDEFWEHRYRWHRVRLYDETVRVSLIMRVPGGDRSKIVHSAVSVVDIAPTVLDLFGLSTTSALTGTSLVPAAYGGALPEDRVVFMASPQYKTYAAVAGEKKLILNQDANLIEYYDLARDPAEQKNLSDEIRVVDDDLYCPLINWIAKHGL
jgi:glucan phosphoethanolaminetransferase (alkaline phosphatase superfamily)